MSVILSLFNFTLSQCPELQKTSESEPPVTAEAIWRAPAARQFADKFADWDWGSNTGKCFGREMSRS